MKYDQDRQLELLEEFTRLAAQVKFLGGLVQNDLNSYEAFITPNHMEEWGKQANATIGKLAVHCAATAIFVRTGK